MTMADIEEMSTLMITPKIAGEVLNLDPHSIRLQAREHPERLGFPVICCGSRVKILREPFVQFVKYGKI